MKDYLAEIIDLTGNSYLNPVPAVYDNGSHLRSIGQITSISIHHDAAFRPHDYDSVARYLDEATTHYQKLGPGLQYHYKIDNLGQIFQIRPLTTWLYCVGSDENVSTLAICLDGYLHNDEKNIGQDPTREQYEALGQLLIELCESHPEFPAVYPDVRPHLDFSSTACPGNRFAPWVLAVNSKADVLNIPASATYDWPEYQASAPTPPASPTVPVPPVVPTPQTPPPVPPPAPAPQIDPPPKEDPSPGPSTPPPVNVPEPSTVPVNPPQLTLWQRLWKLITDFLEGFKR